MSPLTRRFKRLHCPFALGLENSSSIQNRDDVTNTGAETKIQVVPQERLDCSVFTSLGLLLEDRFKKNAVSAVRLIQHSI